VVDGRSRPTRLRRLPGEDDPEIPVLVLTPVDDPEDRLSRGNGGPPTSPRPRLLATRPRSASPAGRLPHWRLRASSSVIVLDLTPRSHPLRRLSLRELPCRPLPTRHHRPRCALFTTSQLDWPGPCRTRGLWCARARRHPLWPGSGGEVIATMSIEERNAAGEAGRRGPRREGAVNVCVATYNTLRRSELARHAEAIGADAMLVIAPYFMRPATGEAVPPPLHRDPRGDGPPVHALQPPVDERRGHLARRGGAPGGRGHLSRPSSSRSPESHHVRDAKVMLGDKAAVFCGTTGRPMRRWPWGPTAGRRCPSTIATARARRLWDGVQRTSRSRDLAAQWRELLPLVRLVFFEADKPQARRTGSRSTRRPRTWSGTTSGHRGRVRAAPWRARGAPAWHRSDTRRAELRRRGLTSAS
jgi:hypothetical protein